MHSCPVSHGVLLADEQLGRLRIFENQHRPRQTIDWHVHEDACLTYLYEGAYVESYRGKTIECAAPSLLLKPAGERHSDRYCGHGAASIVLTLPDVFACGDLLAYIDGIAYLDHGGALSAGEKLRHELRHADTASPMIIDGLLREVVDLVMRERHVRKRIRSRHHWVYRVRDRLYSGYNNGVSIAALAQDENIHPDHLTRTFKHQFGMLPGEYLRLARLHGARLAIVESGQPLRDIAQNHGFADQSHLTRQFKSQFGTTPGRMRRKVRTGGMH